MEYAERGYVQQHRLVMERKLNRRLEPHERVHHMDGNRQHNVPENLELWKVKAGGLGGKDPAGVRASDYHCAGCLCGAHHADERAILAEIRTWSHEKVDEFVRRLAGPVPAA